MLGCLRFALAVKFVQGKAVLRCCERGWTRSAWLGVSLLALCCERIVGIEEREFGAPSDSGGTGSAGRVSGGANGEPPSGGRPSAGSGGLPETGEGGGSAGANSEHGGGQGGAGGHNVVDDQAPSLVRAAPANEERGIEESREIVIEFDEPMDTASVELAYFQQPGTPTFSWSEGHTVLTVHTGLDRPRSVWADDDRPCRDSDVAVTYGLGPRARDAAGNPISEQFSRTFYRLWQVEHTLSPCLDLSGTLSALGFNAAAVLDPSAPCVKVDQSPGLELTVGEWGGQVVVALMSYSFADLARELALESANLAFVFDDPVGTPHQLHGTLLLDETHFGLEPSSSLGVEGEPLGVLATPDVSYPHRTVKDVTDALARRLAPAPDDATDLLVQFRARFTAPVVEGGPDYVRLNGADTAAPTLVVTYTCAACP